MNKIERQIFEVEKRYENNIDYINLVHNDLDRIFGICEYVNHLDYRCINKVVSEGFYCCNTELIGIELTKRGMKL
jgi:hypothetical protein